MSQIITQITPKWESEKVVWGIQSNSVIAGGGYFYSSILTKESVIANLQDRTGKELVESQTLGLESISAANSILETLFVERTDRSSTERSSQIINILNLLTVEDKNIASSDAFDNAVLYRLSFGNIFSLLELPEFDDEDIVSVLKNVLGLERPPPEIPTDDCCECDEEEPTDEKVEDKPKQPRVGPPPTATGPSSCDAIPRSTGIPDMKNSLLICDLPPLEINAIVSQTYKDWEDKQLKENFTIRECANNQNKGDSKFVGSTIGPKKPPSSEPLLPSPELSPEDPEASRSPGTAGPCGDIDLIQSLPQAYQEVLNKYGMRGLIRKAAQCAGLDLPMIDIKEIMLMSFLKQLDCNMFLSFIEAVVELTGLDRGPNITEFWEIEKIASLLKDNIRTVVSNLPADQLDILLKTPEINLAPEYIGVDSSASANASVTVKMPQQIEDIIDVIEKWEPRELISFFESQNLFDILLYAICDQDKSQILEQIVSILEQVSLDDIGSPSVSIDFDENITEVITTIGNLYDKLVKIIQMGLGLELPDLTLDIINFDNFQMVPLGELPELPTVNLDLTPTIDLLNGISVGIANTIIESISEATLSLLKSTIKAVCESCEQGKLGDLDIGNLIGDSAKNSFSAARAQELKNEVVESLRNVLPTNVPFSQVTNSLESLIDEVSSILKPGQTGGLLLGESPPSVTRAVKSIVNGNTQYASIAPALQSEEQIGRMFANIGMLVDKVMLTDKISILTKQTSPLDSEKELLPGCPSPQEQYERNELKKKGIPEEEIEKQIQRSRNRKKKKFSELADLLAKDELMEGVVPPDDCKISPSGVKKPSLSPREPPINDYLLEKTVDVIYDGTYMSFNREVSAFAETITKEQEGSLDTITASIPPEMPLGNVNVLQQAKSGTIPVVAPGLSGFYNNFNNGRLFDWNERNFINAGLETQFIFNIPNPTSELELPPNLRSPDSGVNSNREFKIIYENGFTGDLSLEKYSLTIGSYSPGVTASPIVPGSLEASIGPLSAQGVAPSTINDNILYSYERNASTAPDFVQDIRKEFAGVTDYSPRSDFDQFVEYSWPSGTQTSQRFPTNYSSIFGDIVTNAANYTAASDFFNYQVLSLIDFAPQLSPKQRECGCTDPHLLDLEGIKKMVIQEFEESQCKTTSENIGNSQEASPFDAASVGGVISTIIRLYLVEFSLRSLFVLSRFPLESGLDKTEIVDSLIQDYFTTLILDNVGNLDKKYSADFQRQAVLYHNKISKENGWTKTGSSVVAISNIVGQQLRPTISRLLQILGVEHSNKSVAEIFLEDWLPLFDVPTTEDEVRFSDISDISSLNNISQSPLGGPVFDLEDGNLILERYIYHEDTALLNLPTWDHGVISLEKFKDIVGNLGPDNSKPLSDYFTKASIGLRLTYLPPMGEDSSFTFGEENTREVYYDQGGGRYAQATALDSISAVSDGDVNSSLGSFVESVNGAPKKAYNLIEKRKYRDTTRNALDLNSSLPPGPSQPFPIQDIARRVSPIPLVEVEIPLQDISLSLGEFRLGLDQLWSNYEKNLVTKMTKQTEFNFLFDYCFPIKRIVFLLMTYSSTYFSLDEGVNNLFSSTKEQLKSTFYTMLNVNDPTYENETMRKIGGNKGLAALAENNEDIPGLDLASIIAQTPLLMLKGMAEVADPNIAIAKKIHDTALLSDIDLPMPAASLLAFPMNIIPGAFGPPITPLGVAYLANDAASALLSPKEKELRKNKISEDTNGKIDLSQANNVDNCKEPTDPEPQSGVVPEPPIVEEPCEEKCAALADQVWLNIFSTEAKKYDRELLKSFQSCAMITVDGLYGLQSRDALQFYGPPNPPEAQYPRGGAFTIPDCAKKPEDDLPMCKPCYELATQVQANIISSPPRQYDRNLLRQFQDCAEIVVDGFYGPQTEAALRFYGPAPTPQKQYPTGSPFEEPNCRPPEPTGS